MKMIQLKRILLFALTCLCAGSAYAQINTDQVMRVGQNSLYLEDYVLSIQYFNQVIAAKPYMAQPYFYRAIAKISLEDYLGAEEDASTAISYNRFITGAYEVRGVARQNLGKLKEAVADYDLALEQLPESRGILLNKALALEELKEYGKADTTYAELFKYHPRYDNGLVGRARLYLAMGDTVKASADIDRALELNKNNVNAYVLRADIAINSAKDYARARSDMDEAIKLQPQYAGYFVNRAYLRYQLDDYFGAMADYDYAIQLDPTNVAALFNRGLLRAEVNDNNKAIDDFSKVLTLDPDNYKAMYNRALLSKEIADYKGSNADLNRVIEEFPSFSNAYFLRCENYRLMGERSKAERDYNKAKALARKAVPAEEGADVAANAGGSDREETQEQVAARFTSLLTVDNNASAKEEYATEGIKGRVQDRNLAIEIEPMFTLSYYIATTEIKEVPYYIKEVDDVNTTRALRFVLMTTNREPQISDADAIKKHFESIEYYNGYLETHRPRAIDYFGRAMDYYTLHNYAAAIADLARAIDTAPDFTLAYMLRANARLKNAEMDRLSRDTEREGILAGMTERTAKMVASEALADFEKVIELSPRMAIAYYNKGNILLQAGDYTSALSAYSHAIEIKSDFGEAYYNRGYIYLKLGNKEAGVADLSKAGELGIVPSYNLLKRIAR
jgi:tetratricopeptide (TPR) repeat protein